MAGHSHAHNVKHKKDAADAKRARIFTKICRDIYVCAKQFGVDSPRLKMLLENARKINLPKDNIDRAIKKATDPNAADDMFDMLYEGFAFDGIALLIEACTDNKNRTSANIRAILSKYGGDLGPSAYLFEKSGFIDYSLEYKDEVELLAIDAGAKDILELEDRLCVVCESDKLYEMQEACKQEVLEAKSVYVPLNSLTLNDQQKERFIKMLDALEVLDDVHAIHTNVCKDLS